MEISRRHVEERKMLWMLFDGKSKRVLPVTELYLTYYLRQKKKTDHNIKIVKIVKVFKKIRTIAILMRKDVPNPGKLVW